MSHKITRFVMAALAAVVLAAFCGTAFAAIGDFPEYVHKNQGSKSKVWARAKANVPLWVVRQVAEGVNKMLGRSEFLTLEASERNLRIVVVADGDDIWGLEEFRQDIYSPWNTANDGTTRKVFPTAAEIDEDPDFFVAHPVIVTRVSDVVRRGGDRYEMIYPFAKLFYKIGVVGGWARTPVGAKDDPSRVYNYPQHLADALAKAKAEGLWPNTGMTDSVEDYFAGASMVFWETTPESTDGSWGRHPNGGPRGPVSTRREMMVYDEALFAPMVEIYGEFEYISPYRRDQEYAVSADLGPGAQFPPIQPWMKDTQVNNYDINGSAYPPLAIAEANLISKGKIELVFNRDVKTWTELSDPSIYKIQFTPKGAAAPVAPDENPVAIQEYDWKTVTLVYAVMNQSESAVQRATSGPRSGDLNMVTSADEFYIGDIGYDYGGFQPADIASAGDYVKNDPDIIAGNYNSANKTALKKGDLITIDEMTGEINGKIQIVVDGSKVEDWAGNKLGAKTVDVQIKPWFGLVHRTPEKGVYIYADRGVAESSIKIAGQYIDEILDSEYGPKIADGLTKSHGGLSIIGYHNHAYMQPASRMSYKTGDYAGTRGQYYLYVEGFGSLLGQTTEFNLLRDRTWTRYDDEFILGHEFGHTYDIYGTPVYAPEMVEAITNAYETAVRQDGLWYNSYAGSNRAEYYGTLSNIHHGDMRESTDGTHNGTWTPINTTAELQEYDSVGYKLMMDLYGKRANDMMFVGLPWESKLVPDYYAIDGSLRITRPKVAAAGDNTAIEAVLEETGIEATPENIRQLADITILSPAKDGAAGIMIDHKLAEGDSITMGLGTTVECSTTGLALYMQFDRTDPESTAKLPDATYKTVPQGITMDCATLFLDGAMPADIEKPSGSLSAEYDGAGYIFYPKTAGVNEERGVLVVWDGEEDGVISATFVICDGTGVMIAEPEIKAEIPEPEVIDEANVEAITEGIISDSNQIVAIEQDSVSVAASEVDVTVNVYGGMNIEQDVTDGDGVMLGKDNTIPTEFKNGQALKAVNVALYKRFVAGDPKSDVKVDDKAWGVDEDGNIKIAYNIVIIDDQAPADNDKIERPGDDSPYGILVEEKPVGNSLYPGVLYIWDGHKDGTANDPLIVKTVPAGGGSSGCATGAGFLALLALGAMKLRRK